MCYLHVSLHICCVRHEIHTRSYQERYRSYTYEMYDIRRDLLVTRYIHVECIIDVYTRYSISYHVPVLFCLCEVRAVLLTLYRKGIYAHNVNIPIKKDTSITSYQCMQCTLYVKDHTPFRGNILLRSYKAKLNNAGVRSILTFCRTTCYSYV